MTETELRDLLRQCLEVGCDLEEVQELVRRNGGASLAPQLAAIVTDDDRELAMLAAGVLPAIPWESARPALAALDGERLTPTARTLVAMCFIEAGEQPPFTLTRRDLLAGFAAGLDHMTRDDIDEFLEDVGATPEELEEVLGRLVVDSDEWGRPTGDATPLGAFRAILSDELAGLPPVERGAHLDTAYLLDDYLDGWTDCSGPEEVTASDLSGFAGWYLIAHTSATPSSILEHVHRLPKVIEVIDRHFDTRLCRDWERESRGLAEDVARALSVPDLIGQRSTEAAGDEEAEGGHWEFVGRRDDGVVLRRLEDGTEVGSVVFPREALEALQPGDILNLVLGRRDRGWVALDAGPVYPARVSSVFRTGRGSPSPSGPH